jgi:hypothetical protein
VTRTRNFPLSSFQGHLNLWGEGPNDGTIINESGAAIKDINLTGMSYPQRGLSRIGHSDMQYWYLDNIIEGSDAAKGYGSPLGLL